MHYFHARVGQVRFSKKRTGTHYAELVFLFLVGYVGHAEHCGTFGARKIDALFSYSGGPEVVLKKTR
jgi:hypothetical protein